MSSSTDTGADVAYDDIPTRAREVLDEIYDHQGAAIYWNNRNQMFGNLRPRDVYRSGYSGEVRVLQVLNMLAHGNF